MMPRTLSSITILPKRQIITQSTTTTIFNASHEILINKKQSKIQRWIFGMIIGSAPFLFILICWIFVSLCFNNLFRFYHHKKNQYRRDTRISGMKNILLKTDV